MTVIKISDYRDVVGWCKSCGHACWASIRDEGLVYCNNRRCDKDWLVGDDDFGVIVTPEFVEHLAEVIRTTAASSFDRFTARPRMMPPSSPAFRFSGNITT